MRRTGLEAIRPQVRGIEAYSPKLSRARIVMHLNENPYDLPEDIKAEILERARRLAWSRYPELVPEDLILKLAEHSGWPEAGGIIVGSGSNELLQATLMATLGDGRKAAVIQPTFPLYRNLAMALGADLVEITMTRQLEFDVDAIKDALAAYKPTVLLICSPNNPTGSVIGEAALRSILEEYEGLVLVDEAYCDFSGQTVIRLLEEFDNLVITRTFSKAMSLAGLRFGYLLAQPHIAIEINKAKLPFNVNAFTLTAAQVLLEHAERLRWNVDKIVAERERVFSEMLRIQGVRPYRSHANFILFETDKPARLVHEELLLRGISVRDVSSYPMLERALRVTVCRPEENDAFLSAMREIFARD